MVSGRDFPQQGSPDPTAFCLWDQGGGPGRLVEGEGSWAPTQAPAVSPQERNRAKQQERSLRPRQGSPEGAGREQ